MSRSSAKRRSVFGCAFLGGCLGILLTQPESRAAKLDVLRIGTSGTISSDKEAKEKGALMSLRSFVKDETGLDNEVVREKDWQAVTDKLANAELQIGVYQGYEVPLA